MAESNFVDYVKIYCRSGKGGRGSSHFRREKYIPKGGPDGGDGGRGGHIYLRGNRNYWTLLHLKYERHILATNGESGSAKRSSGKNGEDRVIEVPCGTVVYDADTGEYLCDVTEDGQQVMLLRWKIVSHRSCAIRSPERFAARASMTRADACSACARASQWRRFVTITSSAVSVATMSCSEAVRESMPVEFLADMWIMGVSAVMAWEESAAVMSVSVIAGGRSDLFAAMMSEVSLQCK